MEFAHVHAHAPLRIAFLQYRYNYVETELRNWKLATRYKEFKRFFTISADKNLSHVLQATFADRTRSQNLLRGLE